MACNLTEGHVCAECVDLNDPPYVNTFSPHAAFKHKLLREFARRFEFESFVETGSNRGDTLDFLKCDFKELHSIELHPDLYNYAISRFEKEPRIHLIHGNSGVMLGKVLEKVVQPCLLWIDAHAAGHGTADEGNPLEMELQTIYEKCLTSLAVLDDQWPQDFEKTVVPEGWTKKWHHGLTFIHKTGLYDIPEKF